jgi:D-ribose pyranase
MLQNGILNPGLLSLLARVRHTNRLVIADWAFPYWRDMEVVDLALVKGIPTVPDVLEALSPNFKVGEIWQAEEFLVGNPQETIGRFDTCFSRFPEVRITRLPHLKFKELVPEAIGLVRTGDPTAYGNLILESV